MALRSCILCQSAGERTVTWVGTIFVNFLSSTEKLGDLLQRSQRAADVFFFLPFLLPFAELFCQQLSSQHTTQRRSKTSDSRWGHQSPLGLLYCCRGVCCPAETLRDLHPQELDGGDRLPVDVKGCRFCSVPPKSHDRFFGFACV